jgi:transcriptional regulator with XRE-family HTH domain
MNSKSVLDKLNEVSSKESSKWLDQANWRIENEAWLDKSADIALRILRTLRSKSITQKDLADRLGVSAQYINKIVKGKENLTLDTICKLERALEIELIAIPTFKSIDVTTQVELSSIVSNVIETTVSSTQSLENAEPKATYQPSENESNYAMAA